MTQRFTTALLLCLLAAPCQGADAADAPALVVLIAVDQLRPDRISPSMPGGLGRMMREGFVYDSASLDHALTNTCPGHVVISTGRNPANTGIPGNSYIDHATMEDRYCVQDDDPAFSVPGTDDIRSPRAITASTLGDWLKAAEPGAKVFSVSGKDRAAITMGGAGADAAVWYHEDLAAFVTSGYYGDLPAYVTDFNGSNLFENGAGASLPMTWDHPPGELRPDDFPGESSEFGRVAKRPLNSGITVERSAQFVVSPYLDLLTGDLARIIATEEKLGQRGVTDLLAISYSATDRVGHLYGPFSAESEHALRLLDEEIAELLGFLDEQLDGNYLVALTADHGVLPLPEWLDEENKLSCPVPGGRVDVNDLFFGLLWSLYWEFTFPFGNPMDLFGVSAAGTTVSADAAAEHGTTVPAVTAFLEQYLEAEPGIRGAWTAEEVLDGTTELARLYRNSYIEGLSGHLLLELEESCLISGDEGTTHGTHYPYDRDVPMVFFGRGVRHGVSSDARHSIDIAPTLGERLGLDVPEDLDGVALDVWEAGSD